MNVEIIPAILVKKREELIDKIAKVKPYVRTIQLDIMDGKFVQNKTIGTDELKDLPKANYEFHWMVFDPEIWIQKVPGNHLHLVHVETVKSWDWIEKAVKNAGGRLGIALNPDTPLEKIMPFIDRVEKVLVMTVYPGFSSQKYIPDMESKISDLRGKYPNMDIEVDGGINKDTISRAVKAGANHLAAASAIFSCETVGDGIRQLTAAAEGK